MPPATLTTFQPLALRFRRQVPVRANAMTTKTSWRRHMRGLRARLIGDEEHGPFRDRRERGYSMHRRGVHALSIHTNTARPPSDTTPPAAPVACAGAADTHGSPVARAQCALLERLAALHDAQVEALDKGDLAGLARLSDQRGALVSEAAPYLPPRAPWEPELAPLVAQAQERAGELQQAVRACMAIVRRDLITPAGRRQTAQSPREQQPD